MLQIYTVIQSATLYPYRVNISCLAINKVVYMQYLCRKYKNFSEMKKLFCTLILNMLHWRTKKHFVTLELQTNIYM